MSAHELSWFFIGNNTKCRDISLEDLATCLCLLYLINIARYGEAIFKATIEGGKTKL
jgi:hypothetical protein